MRWISGWEDWTSFDLYAAVATPASAQEVVYNPGYCAQFYPNANCQNKAANSPIYRRLPAA
jgi:hypothetical protein